MNRKASWSPSLCTACLRSLLHPGESFPVTNRYRKLQGLVQKWKPVAGISCVCRSSHENLLGQSLARWLLTLCEWGILSFFRPNTKWHLHCCFHSLLAYHYCDYHTLGDFTPQWWFRAESKVVCNRVSRIPFQNTAETKLVRSWNTIQVHPVVIIYFSPTLFCRYSPSLHPPDMGVRLSKDPMGI